MNDQPEPAATVVVENLPPSPRERLLHHVLDQVAAKSVTSGILHRTTPKHSLLRGLDGSADAPALSQEEWQDALSELDRGRLGDTPSLREQACSAAAEFHERGQVPVFVVDVEYQSIRGRVWSAMERIEQAGGDGELPFTATADLIESRRAFLASAVVPREFEAFVAQPLVHYGQSVTFVFPTRGLLGSAAADTSLRVDFGDGQGLRPVPPDQPVIVNYPSLGNWVTSLELAGSGGTRKAAFSITLVESPLQQLRNPPFVREERAPVWATIRRPGIKVVRAQAFVFRHGDRPRIRRPLLMVEGFPGNYRWDRLFGYANQQNFAWNLFKQGYDLVLVRFPDGPQRLEANAYALIALIQDIIATREGNEPLIIGGFSMGGLIARYALAYMEHERRADPGKPHHQTRKLFTVDSPHEGANIPVSVQALAQSVRGDGDEAKALRTDAAQQLLLTWVDPYPWPDGHSFKQSPLRTEFLRELERVGSMPRELEDTIAIANGAGNGQAQSPPGALAMKYACTFMYYADLCTKPHNAPGALIFQFRNGDGPYRIVAASSGGDGVDSAPGGIQENPIFRRAYNEVPFPVVKSVPIENACFIPTTSALAIAGADYFRQPDLSRSRFKSVTYSHEGNLPHVKLSPTLAEFLIRFITRPPAAAAATEPAMAEAE
jgi:pimeloyl-ACP methyl ester carboxylesterase